MSLQFYHAGSAASINRWKLYLEAFKLQAAAIIVRELISFAPIEAAGLCLGSGGRWPVYGVSVHRPAYPGAMAADLMTEPVCYGADKPAVLQAEETGFIASAAGVLPRCTARPDCFPSDPERSEMAFDGKWSVGESPGHRPIQLLVKRGGMWNRIQSD